MLDEGKGLIHLDISVTDGKGEPVPGLNREDFQLLDEGHPQNTLSFHAFTGQSARLNPPVQIILFVDTFKMSSEQASRVQLGIEQYLRQNGGHPAQPISIFGLSEDGLWTVAHHDSTDGNSLASDLSYRSRIVLSRQPDALRALAFIAAGQRRKRGRKLLLWIGPGCGTGTGIFPANRTLGEKTFNPIYWFATLFREARLSIDELSVDQAGPCSSEYQQYLSGVRTVRDANERFLYKKVLAMESGGSVIDASRDLTAEMNLCVQRAAGFYTLSFDPPAAVQSHEYHSLQVRVDRPGAVARTNTGYYDEPFYSDAPADLSAFLPTPPEEIPKQAAPDDAAQQRMLVLAKDYLEKSIPKLPDFYAMRTTLRYEDTPQLNEGGTNTVHRPLRVVETDKAKVFFRAGDEVVESNRPEAETSSDKHLITHGTFGPILAEVRRPVETPGRMKWLRWESAPEGDLAVFGFEVPAAESRDFEGGCCLPDEEGEDPYRIQAGYHGEIAVNPENGAILRLKLHFDLHEFVPQDLDEIQIDYGSLKIGGKNYVCPMKSVSAARGRSIISLKLWDQSFLTYGPYSTKINDMRFSKYHVFRSESRVLTGYKPVE